jgi:endonuclease-3
MATKTKPDQNEVLQVFEHLSGAYPNAKTELTYEDPFQLLVAVILSAQCTDARVNKTTPELFRHYPSPQAMAEAPLPKLEALIKSCGFYRMKAKSIQGAARDLIERFQGEVPRRMEDLVTLAGVGRKTASVVLNQAFDLPAIAVDTHVNRVANRLGWAHSPKPEKVEEQLKALIPMELWSQVNGLLILHGRRLCKARKPACDQCMIRQWCVFGRSAVKSPGAGAPSRKTERSRRRAEGSRRA